MQACAEAKALEEAKEVHEKMMSLFDLEASTYNVQNFGDAFEWINEIQNDIYAGAKFGVSRHYDNRAC